MHETAYSAFQDCRKWLLLQLSSSRSISSHLDSLLPCAEPPDVDHCNRNMWEGSCNPALFTKIISIIWGALAVAYFIIYMYYNSRARMRLDKLPYNRFRTGNLLQNWQVRRSAHA